MAKQTAKPKEKVTKKTKTLSFDVKVIKDCEKLAKDDSRSFNSWLEQLMKKAIEDSKPKK